MSRLVLSCLGCSFLIRICGTLFLYEMHVTHFQRRDFFDLHLMVQHIPILKALEILFSKPVKRTSTWRDCEVTMYCSGQVRNNIIVQNEAEGLLLGSNIVTYYPFNAIENVNVSFVNNTVVGSQAGPLIIESAGNILVQGNRWFSTFTSEVSMQPPVCTLNCHVQYARNLMNRTFHVLYDLLQM